MSEAYNEALRRGSVLTQQSFGTPIVIELFDGEQLTLPAGTSKDEVLRIAKEATAYHKQHRGLGENVNQFAAGFNRAVLALPMKLAEQGAAGLEALYPAAKLKAQLPQSVSDALTSGAQSGYDFLTHVQGYDLPPVNPAGRFLNKTGEVAGAVLPFTGASVMAAPRVAAMTEGSRALIPGAVNTMAKSIAANPGKVALLETAASVPAGMGAGVAQEAYPGNQTAETIGMLLGGFSPMATKLLPSRLAAKYLSKPALNVASAAMAELPELVVSKIPFGQRLAQRGQALSAKESQRAVSTMLGGELGPEAQAGMQSAADLRRSMPGFNPTLAEMTGSPVLKAEQTAIQRQAAGGELRHLAERRAASEAAVAGYAARSAPAGSGSPEFIIDTAAKRVDRLRSGVSQQAMNAAQYGEQQIAGQLPEISRKAVGASMRENLVEMRRGASREMSALRERLGLNRAKVSVPFTRFQDEVRVEFSPKSAFEDVRYYPRVVKDILDADQGVVTFGDMVALRERISDDLIDAMATPSGRTKQVRHLVALKEKVDGQIDSLAAQGRFVESGSAQMLEGARKLRRSRQPKGVDLTSWIISKGGLRESGGELGALDARLRPGLINNKRGRTLDDAALIAWEQGYFPGKMDRPDVNEFLEALRGDFSGRRKLYISDDLRAEGEAELRGLDEQFERAGIDWRNLPDAQLEAEILQKFGTAQPAAAGLAQKYRQFRDTYKREFVDRFEQGAAFKVRQKDGQGFYRVPDEEVASHFFAAGDIEGAQQFKRVFGNDPAAMDAMESVALDDLRAAAVRNGVLEPKLADAWLRRHVSVLNEFPSVKRAVSVYDQAQAALVERQAQLTARARDIEDQVFVKEIARYQKGKPAADVIREALEDPRKMLSLRVSLHKTKEALAALQRHVWDSIANKPAPEIQAFLSKNAKSLQQLFSAQHVSDLRRIAQARAMLESVPAPVGQAARMSPGAALENLMGVGIPQLSSRIFAVQSGRTSARFAGTELFGRFFRARRQADLQALVREALYNPEIARDLAGLTTSAEAKVSPEKLRRINAWLFALGYQPEAAEQ